MAEPSKHDRSSARVAINFVSLSGNPLQIHAPTERSNRQSSWARSVELNSRKKKLKRPAITQPNRLFKRFGNYLYTETLKIKKKKRCAAFRPHAQASALLNFGQTKSANRSQ